MTKEGTGGGAKKNIPSTPAYGEMSSIFAKGDESCNAVWKGFGRWPRFLIIADRCLAKVGRLLFAAFLQLSPLLFAVYFLSWYILAGSEQWIKLQIHFLILSTLCCQFMLAFLRQSFFHNSVALYAALGGLFAMCLIFVSCIAMRYLGETIGLTTLHIISLTSIQVIETMWVCITIA
jgi:hypothetical protein